MGYIIMSYSCKILREMLGLKYMLSVLGDINECLVSVYIYAATQLGYGSF
jgi:hypothetical protein